MAWNVISMSSLFCMFGPPHSGLIFCTYHTVSNVHLGVGMRLGVSRRVHEINRNSLCFDMLYILFAKLQGSVVEELTALPLTPLLGGMSGGGEGGGGGPTSPYQPRVGSCHAKK